MGRLIPRAVAALGVGFPPALLSRIGLRAYRRRAGGGMSYDQVLAATLQYRAREKTVAELRKKKRRGRRAREREQIILFAPGWPM